MTIITYTLNVPGQKPRPSVSLLHLYEVAEATGSRHWSIVRSVLVIGAGSR